MKKIILTFITIAVLMITGTMTTVYAGEEDRVPDVDAGRKCSLTVSMVKSGEAIEGAGIEIIQVAGLETKGGAAKYTLLEAFAKSGVELEGISVSGSADAAAVLSEIAKKKGITGFRDITNSKGKAYFDSLQQGIYLVRQVSQSGIADKYDMIKPFLAMVPEVRRNTGGNEWNYDVTAVPKAGIVSDPGIVDRDPPIRKIVKGNPLTDGVFTFRLTAEKITNPMPDGSEKGVRTINVNGAGIHEFGVWHYTEAGTYRYFISEVNTGAAGYSYDTSVYTLTDKVSYKGGRLVLETSITDSRGKSVDSIVFTNKYSYAKAIRTGDSSIVIPFIALMLICAAAVLGIITRRRNKTSDSE